MKEFFKNKKEDIKETVSKFKDSDVAYLDLESIDVEGEKIFLNFKDSGSNTLLVDITDQLLFILEDKNKITNTNIQKIYRELDRVFECSKDEEDRVYLDKFLLYKALYKACSSVLITVKEVYPEVLLKEVE